MKIKNDHSSEYSYAEEHSPVIDQPEIEDSANEPLNLGYCFHEDWDSWDRWKEHMPLEEERDWIFSKDEEPILLPVPVEEQFHYLRLHEFITVLLASLAVDAGKTQSQVQGAEDEESDDVLTEAAVRSIRSCAGDLEALIAHLGDEEISAIRNVSRALADHFTKTTE